MGVDLRLYIPPHVNMDDIMCIVKHFARDPDLIKKKLNCPTCDVNKPSTPTNSWYFSEKQQKSVSSVDPLCSTFICKYNFLGIEDRMFYLHYENHTYKKETLGFKLFSAKSAPIHIAVASCLVKMFGGYLTYCDSSDLYDLVVSDEQALYSSKNYICDDSDTHYYKIINFVDKLAPISTQDLIQANSNSAYTNDEEEIALFSNKIDTITSEKEKLLITKAIKPILNSKVGQAALNDAGQPSSSSQKKTRIKKIKI